MEDSVGGPSNRLAGATRGGATVEARRAAPLPLVALAFILLVTFAWWALALWPTPGAAPGWLLRTRAVCFGTTETGLPNAGGWLLLVGEPIAMVSALLALWAREVRRDVRQLARTWTGRAALVGSVLLVGAGVLLAMGRVARASASPERGAAGPVNFVGSPAPVLALIDQHGVTLDLAQFHGRPVIVTFAYGHCETVCPLLVHDAVRAQATLADVRPVLLVVTLDPWRDTPERLPALAARWELAGPDAHALSGSIEGVNAVLDAWRIPRARDPGSGELTHSGMVFVVDRTGRITYRATGSTSSIVQLVRRSLRAA